MTRHEEIEQSLAWCIAGAGIAGLILVALGQVGGAPPAGSPSQVHSDGYTLCAVWRDFRSLVCLGFGALVWDLLHWDLIEQEPCASDADGEASQCSLFNVCLF